MSNDIQLLASGRATIYPQTQGCVGTRVECTVSDVKRLVTPRRHGNGIGAGVHRAGVGVIVSRPAPVLPRVLERIVVNDHIRPGSERNCRHKQAPNQPRIPLNYTARRNKHGRNMAKGMPIIESSFLRTTEKSLDKTVLLSPPVPIDLTRTEPA